MKNTVLLFAAVLAFAGRAVAQVSVDVLLEEHQFLASESIPIAVRVNNHSGQTLRFGEEAWVSYAVESRDGFIVAKNSEVPMAHNFSVESASMATQRGDLAQAFTILRPGGYTVTATVHVKDWDKEIVSAPMRFDIVAGTKIWEEKFGVPPKLPGQGEPEVRKYALLRAAYLKHLRLYLRLTDATDSKVFKVVTVGGVVSFSRPQTVLDKRNNLHVLFEDGARSFNYSVINTEGEIVIRQTHRYTENAPRLKVDETGEIAVAGGMRQMTANDLPRIKPVEKPTNDLPQSKN